MEHDLAPFRGFGPRATTFWADLVEDNSRAFFDEHRDVYEQDIRIPMEQLLADVAEEFGHDAKVFRPNRDVRFSKDKSPYKLHCGAVVHDGTPASPVYYTHVGADGLLAASGYHQMSRDQVQRYLDAVGDDTHGPHLEELVAAARDAGMAIGGSELKTAPRGWPRDHARIELLRHKGLTVSRTWPPRAWLQTREALVRVTKLWRGAAPINDWLTTNVGAPRQVDPGRP